MKQIYWLLIVAALSAADPEIKTETAMREAYLGDPVTVAITFTFQTSDWTSFKLKDAMPEKLGDATVLSHQVEAPQVEPDSPNAKQVIVARLAWYALGETEVPALDLVGIAADGSEQAFTSDALTLEIIPMLTETDQEPAPGKGMVQLEGPPLWPWILAAVLLLALAGFLFWKLTRREKGEKPVPPKPLKPPYDEALEALEKLTHGSLLKEGRVKDFYVEVNRIVRRYYARLFQIHAEEMTSFELEVYFEQAPTLPAGLIEVNNAFQEACDHVKFAKHDPVEAENQETVNRAYQIVEMLRPKPEEVTSVQTG